MKIPSKIKIGARTHKIVFPHTFELGHPSRGMISHITGDISLEGKTDGQDYSPENVWQTLIHEIIHQIGRITQTQVLQEDEDSIERIAELVLAIIVDNKWLKPEV